MRTRLDLAKNGNHKQAVQKTHHDLHAKERALDVDQRVMASGYQELPLSSVVQ